MGIYSVANKLHHFTYTENNELPCTDNNSLGLGPRIPFHGVDLAGRSGLFEVSDVQRFRDIGFVPSVVVKSTRNSFIAMVPSFPHINRQQLEDAKRGGVIIDYEVDC